ncbi:hypothetical protein F2Q69_00035282 [Brassica cretica]|uniref:Uncharacterized protein n=1 Tax=Brassica cretica TaxID=69181 RepID=A0A8S9SGB8_BRACR|nr:hypothetical protein F2Q69_00035282 [Brassica cretica]
MDSGKKSRGRNQNQPIEKAEGMAVSMWPDIFHLFISRPEPINVLRQIDQQRSRISANTTRQANQNTIMTTIKYKNRKKRANRSLIPNLRLSVYNKVSAWALRAVGEIPSSSNPKTAKPS